MAIDNLEGEIEKILPKQESVNKGGFFRRNKKLLIIIVIVLLALYVFANIYFRISLPIIFEKASTFP